MGERVEYLSNKQAVELAKIEAKTILTGNELDKCLTALDNWLKNNNKES